MTASAKPQTPATTNGPAKPTVASSPIATLRDLLDKSKGQMALAMPRHMTPDRMIRVALTAVQRVPKLLECDAISIFGCVMQAAELGLELTGPLGQAYMIPYWNAKSRRTEAQFQIGYRGYLRLAFNSGMVATFNARVVKEKDEFQYEYGTDPKLHHVEANGERGEPTHVYAVLRLKDGTSDFEVMSWGEILKHRDKYSKAYADPKLREYSPWTTAPEEMARKTVIRRLAKRAPLSPEINVGIAHDEHGERVVATNVGAFADASAAVHNRIAAIEGGIDTPAAEEAAGSAEGEIVMATKEQHDTIQALLTQLGWATKNYLNDFRKRRDGADPSEMTVEVADEEITRLQGLAGEVKGE